MLFIREEVLNFYTMNSTQKHMIIVESPAKIKKIMKYLPDKNYIVDASVGHIRDLPPKEIGIDIDNNFTPTYVDSEDSKDVIKKLKKLQLPLEIKKKKSDFIIKNNFTNNKIKKNVKRVLEKILLND